MNEAERFQRLIRSGMASLRQMEQGGEKAVLQAKSSGQQYRSTAHEVGVEDEERRILRYIATTSEVNRAGDVVLQSGIDDSRWQENPVAFYGHDSEKYPIARGRGALIPTTTKDGFDAHAVLLEYPPEGINPNADIAYGLGSRGFLKAMSIGFIPHLTASSFSDEEDDRQAVKDAGVGRWGVLFKEIELLEVSPCGIPMVPSAVQQGLKELVEVGGTTTEHAERFEKINALNRKRFMGSGVEEDQTDPPKLRFTVATLSSDDHERLIASISALTREVTHLRRGLERERAAAGTTSRELDDIAAATNALQAGMGRARGIFSK